MEMIKLKGYCYACVNNPDISINLAAKDKASPCFGCWFTEEKVNWVGLNKGEDHAAWARNTNG